MSSISDCRRDIGSLRPVNTYHIRTTNSWQEQPDMPQWTLILELNNLEETMLNRLDTFYSTLLRDHSLGRVFKEGPKMRNTIILKKRRCRQQSRHSLLEFQKRPHSLSIYTIAEILGLMRNLTINIYAAYSKKQCIGMATNMTTYTTGLHLQVRRFNPQS